MIIEYLLEKVISEAKIDDILTKLDISEDDKERIRQLNNRLRNKVKYVGYLVKYYKEKDIVELIDEFDKLYQRLEQKDINQYKIEDLRNILKLSKEKKTRSEIKSSGADKLAENDKYIFYLIKNEGAAILYGKGTQWCIAAKENNMFDYYNENNNVYYMIPKSGIDNDKIAIISDSNKTLTIFNAENHEIDIEIPKEFSILIKPNYDQIFKFKQKLIDNGDGTYNADTNIDIPSSLVQNGKLVIRFNKVNGNFNVFGAKLISLEGCPIEVSGDFNCGGNKLTSLKYCPSKVGKDFFCYNNELITLEGCPREVGTDFYCDGNKLISLKECPTKINGIFDCSSNYLTTLEDSPMEVSGDFMCHDNDLISLIGGPIKVGLSFNCSYNKLISLDGCPKEVGMHFLCHKNKIKFTKEYVKKYCDVKYSIRVE